MLYVCKRRVYSLFVNELSLLPGCLCGCWYTLLGGFVIANVILPYVLLYSGKILLVLYLELFFHINDLVPVIRKFWVPQTFCYFVVIIIVVV